MFSLFGHVHSWVTSHGFIDLRMPEIVDPSGCVLNSPWLQLRQVLVSRSRQSLHATQRTGFFGLGIGFSLPFFMLSDESHAGCGLRFVEVGSSQVSQGLTLGSQSFACLALSKTI